MTLKERAKRLKTDIPAVFLAGWKAKEVVLRHSDCCFLAACDRAAGKADLVLKMIQDITTILR